MRLNSVPLAEDLGVSLSHIYEDKNRQPKCVSSHSADRLFSCSQAHGVVPYLVVRGPTPCVVPVPSDWSLCIGADSVHCFCVSIRQGTEAGSVRTGKQHHLFQR